MSERTEKKRRPYMAIFLAFFAIFGLVALALLLFFQPTMTDHAADRKLSNMKQADLGIMMYAADSDDLLPLAANWMDSTRLYTKQEQVYHSPGIPEIGMNGQPQFGIAFRRSLASANLDKIFRPEEVALIFDSSDLSRNASGELELLPNPPRYGSNDERKNLVGFADGHAKFIPAMKFIVR
jgi:hypothetical protein